MHVSAITYISTLLLTFTSVNAARKSADSDAIVYDISSFAVPAKYAKEACKAMGMSGPAELNEKSADAINQAMLAINMDVARIGDVSGKQFKLKKGKHHKALVVSSAKDGITTRELTEEEEDQFINVVCQCKQSTLDRIAKDSEIKSNKTAEMLQKRREALEKKIKAFIENYQRQATRKLESKKQHAKKVIRKLLRKHAKIQARICKTVMKRTDQMIKLQKEKAKVEKKMEHLEQGNEKLAKSWEQDFNELLADAAEEGEAEKAEYERGAQLVSEKYDAKLKIYLQKREKQAQAKLQRKDSQTKRAESKETARKAKEEAKKTKSSSRK